MAEAGRSELIGETSPKPTDAHPPTKSRSACPGPPENQEPANAHVPKKLPSACPGPSEKERTLSGLSAGLHLTRSPNQEPQPTAVHASLINSGLTSGGGWAITFGQDKPDPILVFPMVHQIQESEFTGPPLTEGAFILGTPDSISIRNPIKWESYWEETGLGPAKIAVFKLDSGSIFSLQYLEALSKDNVLILYVMRGNIGEHVDEVLSALGMTTADLRWLPKDICLPAARLIRQDDNGVRFNIGDYPCRADAEAIMSRLAKGGHKQAYFIESIIGKGPSLRFSDVTRGPPSVIPV